MPTRTLHPETLAIREQAARTAHREHAVPIFLTSSFVFDSAEQARALFADEIAGNIYSRFTNPNVDELVRKLCQLEGAESGIATATGMASVFVSLAGLLSAGDHLIASRALFGSTHQLLTKVLPRWGITHSYVDASAPIDEWERAVQPQTKLAFVETPSNPGLELVDLESLGTLCRARGLVFVVDNCFSTPLLQQPIRYGADLVVHSATKYIDGQGRTMGGVVVGRADKVAELRFFARQTGPSLSPFNGWILSKSLETLAVRMERHSANALRIARHFDGHADVERVRYPFLPSHPQYELARRQMTSGGGIVTLEVTGGGERAFRFLDAIDLLSHSANLGDTRTIVTHPASTTHAKLSEPERARVGITPGLVRISVGLEHPEDIIADLERALARSGVVKPAPATVGVPSRGDVVLLGVGAIGRELIGQLVAGNGSSGLRVCALIDSTAYLFEPNGLSSELLLRAVQVKAAGRQLASIDHAIAAQAADALQSIANHHLAHPILVDATAADTTELLETSLARGWNVVLANKVPLAGGQGSADRLTSAARAHGRQILYEATVGAGLPVIDTLRKLLEAGDRVLKIEGCPSGTLGYLFGELARGRAFSAALTSAIQAGYTEPDPRVDLSGVDVARKALILGRAIGFRGDLADVTIESLVPHELQRLPLPEFLARVNELDALWEARVHAARAEGKLLRYRARVSRRSLEVGLVSVPVTSPLASLSGTDNQFAFTTARYHAQPLVISGPGAGAAVTAGGLYNDLWRLAERSAWSAGQPHGAARHATHSEPASHAPQAAQAVQQ